MSPGPRLPRDLRLSPRRKARRGFALLITITLLAFLVLLLVSLAALTRVETQIAGNNQHLAQARQNALLALNIAVGELQKYTGPDQRTTARADMDATLVPATASTPITFSGRWLGAYGNGAVADYTMVPTAVSTAVVNASDAKGSQAKLLNWFVSGNEGTTFDPASDVGPAGNITTPPTQFQFTPHGTVSGLAAGIDALTTTLTVTDKDNTAHPARLLVGPATVGNSLADHVVAPLRTIEAIAPGQGDDPVTIGHYAWWIGDEGTKARINHPSPSPAQAPLAFVSTQRAAIELVDGVNPSATTTLDTIDMLGGAYAPDNSDIPRLLSPGQLPMLNPSQLAAIRRATQYRYHDLTAFSSSLFADAYAGGLKKDLSSVLATGATVPADDDPIFQPEGTLDFGLPTWGQLRSFAGTTAPDSGLKPLISTPTQGGLSPIMTYAALGFQYVAPEGDSDGAPVRLAIYPLVVLWNPYTTPIAASDYEFGMQWRGTDKSWIQLQSSTEDASGTETWNVKETRSLQKAGGTRTTGTNATYFRFKITTEALPAGQSIIYTLQSGDSGVDYSAPATDAPSNTLRRGFNPVGHVLLSSSLVIGATETGRDFRVAVNRNDSSAAKTIPGTLTYSFIGSSNMNGTSGELCAYLGEVVKTQPTGFDVTTGDKRWYQFLSRFSPGTSPAYSDDTGLLQGPASLTIPTGPVFSMVIKANFGGTSTPVRWLAQSNPRALLITRNPRPFGVTGDGIDSVPPGFNATSSTPSWPLFVVSDDERASAGPTLDAATDGSAIDATLFEHRPHDQPLLTIGQLQHANLGWDNAHPAYAIGNSLADYRFKGRRHQVVFETNATGPQPTNQITGYYDYSWLLNRSLWDRHFVSTVPNVGTGTATDIDIDTLDIPLVLPNPRHMRIDDYRDTELRSADRAAAHLLLSGGFNINSTSEQAWRAVLGGINQLAYNPVDPTNPSARQAALPRFSKPTFTADADSQPWQGYRQLTEAQIARLARDIITEIRNRGPFVSLHDFINRRLVDGIATPTTDERLKGVIQTALDATTTGPAAANSSASAPFDDAPTYIANAYQDIDAMRGGPASVAPYSSRSAFAPQYLTQADVLSAIGAGLSARSDTFTIRTCGEVVNPALTSSDSGYITGRAWCEAVVQRLPEYLDPDDNAYSPPTSGSVNQHMGRRFKIISFRWLSPSDI